MTNIPDGSPGGYGDWPDDGFTVYAVGWLGDEVPTKGSVHPEIIRALRLFRDRRVRADDTLGYHDCEICLKEGVADPYIDREEIHIEIGQFRYVLPKMILHYIEAHDYLPPKQFCDDLLKYWLEDYPKWIEETVAKEEIKTGGKIERCPECHHPVSGSKCYTCEVLKGDPPTLE